MNFDIKGFFKKCLRVLKVTKKPDKEEYLTSAKITGIGILIIGAIGFTVFLLSELPGLLGV